MGERRFGIYHIGQYRKNSTKERRYLPYFGQSPSMNEHVEDGVSFDEFNGPIMCDHGEIVAVHLKVGWLIGWSTDDVELVV